MSRRMITLTVFSVASFVFAASGTVNGQFGIFNNDCCNPCPRPVPVVQNCYRTVPVTEYKRVEQVVQRPVVETKYVEEPVTEYRPVVRQKTANVPQVTYQNVTENKIVYRNAGRWHTEYRCNQKISPCQYDNRPNFAGWLNRSAYSIRSSFTPRVTAHRRYVPNVIAQTIPVTRQVAVRSTRRVTYNVTEMVAYRTTRRVAVNTVKMVPQKMTVMRPVTVMRTIPIGTSVAYAYPGYGGTTATAFGTPIPSTSTALAPTPDPISARPRTANRLKKNEGFKRSNNADFDEFNNNNDVPGQKSGFVIPQRKSKPTPRSASRRANSRINLAASSRHTSSSGSSGWKARRSATPKAGPTLQLANLKVVDNR